MGIHKGDELRYYAGHVKNNKKTQQYNRKNSQFLKLPTLNQDKNQRDPKETAFPDKTQFSDPRIREEKFPRKGGRSRNLLLQKSKQFQVSECAREELLKKKTTR